MKTWFQIRVWKECRNSVEAVAPPLFNVETRYNREQEKVKDRDEPKVKLQLKE